MDNSKPQVKRNFAKIKEQNANMGHLLDIIFIALFSALIAVLAQISIPTTVPFTLQTLGVFITASMLGWKRGTLSVVIYILLGAVGLPVFAGFSGGVGTLIGPTGGYIIGFLFTAVAVGVMTQLLGKKLWVLAVSMIIGLALCYVMGTIWFCVSTKAEILYALSVCVVPFLIADTAKIIVATILVNRLDKIIEL